MKYHVRLPQVSDVGGVVDYYQWLAILKVVGARRAYRVLYKGRVEPAQVAELLITRNVFPRSLAFCYEQITHHLEAIEVTGFRPRGRGEAAGALPFLSFSIVSLLVRL